MLEHLHPDVNASHARVVLFDFDGTLSLIRSGWMNVMIPLMVELLSEVAKDESEAQIREVVEEFVWRLTGKQTIYQTIELAEQIRKRGGTPKEPLEYKRMYLDRLWTEVRGRVKDLKDGAPPDRYMVPGSRQLLEGLKDRGLRMYLASGTDEAYMKEEARLLDVTKYFDGGVFGALDDYKSFSKAILIQRIIRNAECSGDEFLGFGDGYVEIENVKQVGGVAVGAATDEPDCLKVDIWKRNRLAGVGADIIVPNYLETERLLKMLFPN